MKNAAFLSPQDTVVAIEALSQVAQILYTPDSGKHALKVVYHYLPRSTNRVQRGAFHLDHNNKMVLMKREVRV